MNMKSLLLTKLALLTKKTTKSRVLHLKQDLIAGLLEGCLQCPEDVTKCNKCKARSRSLMSLWHLSWELASAKDYFIVRHFAAPDLLLATFASCPSRSLIAIYGRTTAYDFFPVKSGRRSCSNKELGEPYPVLSSGHVYCFPFAFSK